MTARCQVCEDWGGVPFNHDCPYDGSRVGDYMPTEDDCEHAMKVLLWLHEWADDGSLRDDISHVRHVLDELIAEGETW